MVSEESDDSNKRKGKQKKGGKKKNLRAPEEEDVEEEPQQQKKPSASRQWAQVLNGGGGSGPRKRAAQKATAVISMLIEERDADVAGESFVHDHLEGSGLDIVQRNTDRDKALKEAQAKRHGGRKKAGHVLDPEMKKGVHSACWVFFRSAQEGENKAFIYCKACEMKENGAAKNAATRVRIQDYGTPTAKLHSGNAESHLKQHAEWWKIVHDAAKKGYSPKKAFDDLMRDKEPRTVQRQATMDGFARKAKKEPGRLEKEMRTVINMVKHKIPFDMLNSSTYNAMMDSYGVKLGSTETLKRLLFALSEIALRHAEAQIKEAGTYSIALDYWTSLSRTKYLAITYHYTDKEMRVRSRVLNMVEVTANATALLTKQIMESALEKHFEKTRRLFKE